MCRQRLISYACQSRRKRRAALANMPNCNAGLRKPMNEAKRPESQLCLSINSPPTWSSNAKRREDYALTTRGRQRHLHPPQSLPESGDGRALVHLIDTDTEDGAARIGRDRAPMSDSIGLALGAGLVHGRNVPHN